MVSQAIAAFRLNVPKLLLRHSEIVPQFVYKSLADLVTDFDLASADRFNILLIKDDVIRPNR